MIEHPVLQFAKLMLKRWWALMSCAAFTFLGIWTAYANKGREWVLWGSFLLGIVFLIVAAYRTWLAEHHELLTKSQAADALIQGLKEEHARDSQLADATIQRLKEESARNSQAADGVIRGLKEELARKHPYDEQAEAAVRKAISKLGDAEVRFLAWLLTVDRPRQGQVQGQGFRGEPDSILQKTSTLLIGFEPICPGNGLVEMDRIYYVNPKSEPAIKNVLYPIPKR
jgi:hypothetical protein